MQSDTQDCAADRAVNWWDSHWRSVLYSFLAGMLFAFVLAGCNAAYAASYSKPSGAPTITVPNYGVEVGVWATQTAIGHGIGVFENNGSGWSLCGQCVVDPAYPTLDGAVANAGGPGPYVASKLDKVNAVLASRYPAIGGESAGTTLDKVNGALGAYQLRLVNGSPQIGTR